MLGWLLQIMEECKNLYRLMGGIYRICMILFVENYCKTKTGVVYYIRMIISVLITIFMPVKKGVKGKRFPVPEHAISMGREYRKR